ncbi:hypothetical protein UlMin_003852 [Ulmus minor]
MDPSPVQTTPSIEEEDEWDADGFVIPSLAIEEPEQINPDASKVEASNPPSPKAKIEENIYLGPHGAPPSQSKQQEPPSRKQRFKQKLKEADRRTSGSGRENKLENLQELVGGGGKVSSGGGSNMRKGTTRDWLDPHCHESHFEKWHQQ